MNTAELQRFESPAARWLGREILSIDEVCGAAVARYTTRPEFMNAHGTVQGGMLAAILDSATALALYAALPVTHTAVTMALSVHYLQPVQAGTFTAHSELISRDEREALTRADLLDERGVCVARAEATLRIVSRATLLRRLEDL